MTRWPDCDGNECERKAGWLDPAKCMALQWLTVCRVCYVASSMQRLVYTVLSTMCSSCGGVPSTGSAELDSLGGRGLFNLTLYTLH